MLLSVERGRVAHPLILLLAIVAGADLSCSGRGKASDAPPVAPIRVKPGDHVGRIVHGGLRRTYRVHVPPSFDGTSRMPLVLVLHGGFGTGKKMERLTLRGFNHLSDKEGFIVVYPDGIERHWNDGREEARYRSHKEKIDDVGFLSALIDHFVATLNADEGRVYVTGVSNGGMMSHRLAFELTGKIAAIAPVAGSIASALAPDAAPTVPISVMIMNNTEDELVPWEGGQIGFRRMRVGNVLSTPDAVAFWVKHNGCAETPVVTQEPDRDPNDGTRVRREVHTPGKAGAEVILVAIEGGGHTWPGGQQYLSRRTIGKTSRDINACEVIWEFFKRQRRIMNDE